MTDNETTKETSTEQAVQKSDSAASPSEIELLTTLVKSQQEQIAGIVKKGEEDKSEILKAIGELKKMDANPVDHGAAKDEKPKVSDKDDVGGTPKDEPSYAPDGDAAGSIRAPSDEAPKTDSIKVSKADEEKKKEEEKKEEKMDKSEAIEKSEKPEEIRKSVAPDGFEYTVVKAVRPKYQQYPDTPETAPTGYQVMKAMFDGWGGKHTDFEKSFVEGYNRLLKGEFGTGDVR